MKKLKLISDKELENIYFSNDTVLKENVDIDMLKKKYDDCEKKDKKIKMYKKILNFQKNEIIKNQNILNNQNNKKNKKNNKNNKQNVKGGQCNNINTVNDVINQIFELNTNSNYYDIKKKSLINKILFVISNIIFTILLFIIAYNLIYFNYNETINLGSIILSILLYILYKLINILEENICNNNNAIYNLDTYIENLNNYITSTELSSEKKQELLEEVNKYKNIFNKTNIINYINVAMNDLIIYLPFLIFIILYILINTDLTTIVILTIIITLIITPYINIITYYNTTNKNIINIGYIFEKLLILYISYLIINIIYNKHTLLNISDLILLIVKKMKN